MGRKPKPPVNKSQAVRDYVQGNPAATVKQVAAAVSAQLGQEVLPQLVYAIRSNGKKRTSGIKATRLRHRSNGQSVNGHEPVNGQPHPWELLVSLQALSGRMGGLKETARALAALEQLTK